MVKQDVSHRGPVSETETYEVGYGKPPKETRFGARPQPHRAGRARASASQHAGTDIAELLDRPIEIQRNGKRQKVHPHEAMLEALFLGAMAGKIGALKQFLAECTRAGLLEPSLALACGAVQAPRDVPLDLAGYIIRNEGLPPWDDRILKHYRAEYEADVARIAELKREALAKARADGENVY
ncbi:DUF5681 domain-containing protein [Bradyrhizobium sp. WSM1417]|uniref:DUF5681 domain-containing protein n=1 Tax=Bradyrhizobium sp. WSM1417 TaxID=754500 RepID=UPI0012EB0832|nr:DUF5681 domain-containing protein [Bradyrhizobium sp. WSM1417]